MKGINGAGQHPMNSADHLYSWWLEAVPSFLAGLAPPSTAADADAEDTPATSSPIGHITQALDLAQRLMKPVSEVLLQALALNQSGEAVQLLEDLLEGWTNEMMDRLTTSTPATWAQPGPTAALGAGWLAASAQAMQPLSLSFERTFGGLVDAFGLASLRELQQALLDMAAASVTHQQAQAEYLGLIVGGLAKGNHAVISRLTEMGRRGESVDSVKSLVRLWARAADDEMHVQMQSPAALELSARLVRASARSRQQQHRIVAIASEALNVPTRSEVDDAYRDIQELKRELRRLRRSLASDGVTVATAAAGQPMAPRSSGKPSAKRSPERPRPLAARKSPATRKPG